MMADGVEADMVFRNALTLETSRREMVDEVRGLVTLYTKRTIHCDTFGENHE